MQKLEKDVLKNGFISNYFMLVHLVQFQNCFPGVKFRAKFEVHSLKYINPIDSARCSGPYEKIPPAPGTNQIAGFVEFHPLTEKKAIILLALVGSEMVPTRRCVPRWLSSHI